MNRRRVLLAAVSLAVIATIPMLNPQRLLAQVRAALVRDVDGPGRDPVVLTASPTLKNHNAAFTLVWGGGLFSSAVPSGKRLIIDYISVVSMRTNGNMDLMGFLVRTRLHGQTVDSWISIPLHETSSGWKGYSGGAAVHIYADPSTTVETYLQGDGADADTAQFSGFGHFVDIN